MAQEGADIIAVDICGPATTTDFAVATPEDLEETVRQVEAQGRRIVHAVADVRDLDALDELVGRGVAEFGRLDIVVANAGVVTWGRFWELDPKVWQDVIDINLTGVFNTLRVAAPRMIEAGNGGSIIATSSVAGIKALPAQAPYVASKHGVVGIVKAAAIELAPYGIRVNSIHPWGVETPMGVMGPDAQRIFAEHPQYGVSMGQLILDPGASTVDDIANAALFLASDESRTITGVQLPVDHGATKV